jgi:hypothetical protein
MLNIYSYFGYNSAHVVIYLVTPIFNSMNDLFHAKEMGEVL